MARQQACHGCVNMLHTFPTFKENCKRLIQDTQTSEWNRTSIPRPTVIGLYNESMGGTDLMD
jgi:hypothetical protein